MTALHIAHLAPYSDDVELIPFSGMLMHPIPCAKSVAAKFLVVGVALSLAQSAHAGPSYSYDALGRVISVRYDNGNEIRYVYDAAVNRTQMVVSATTGNRKPVANTDTVTINESAASITFDPRANDTDPDNNPLTILSVSNGDQGTATVSGGTSVTYSTGVKRAATDRLSYVISDGQGMDATGDINIVLANLPPVPVTDAISTAKFAAKTFDPRANDSDPGGDTFIVSAASTPAHGTASVAADGTTLTYTPVTTYVGADTFTYTIRDIEGATATGTVNATVTNGAYPPLAVNDSKAPVKNIAETFDPRTNDSDPDGGPITITAKTNGSKGTVTINSGTSLTYTPNTNATGADSITYTIADNDNQTATATVAINILVTNTPPVAVNDSVTTHMANTGPNAGSNLVQFDPRFNDYDADGHSFTVTAKTNGTYGSVTILNSGTTVKYLRTSNFPVGPTLSDTFTYTINDGHGGTGTATVNVSVPYEPYDPGGTN